MRKILKLGDIIVVAVVLAISALMVLFSASDSADYAVIYVNGTEFGRYSLSADETRKIKVMSDQGYNMVQIENHKVYVTDTSCEDKLEVAAGPIKKAGQSLVCLPNRVVITIEGGERTDATAF